MPSPFLCPCLWASKYLKSYFCNGCHMTAYTCSYYEGNLQYPSNISQPLPIRKESLTVVFHRSSDIKAQSSIFVGTRAVYYKWEGYENILKDNCRYDAFWKIFRALWYRIIYLFLNGSLKISQIFIV